MHRIWFWAFLLIATIIVSIFHTKVHRYNVAHKNLIISSMYKDVRPYWLARGILMLIFLFLFFCYKPIVLPEIKYVDRIKLNTVDNHLEQSLGIESCKDMDVVNKKSCTYEERNLYGCDDSPDCDGKPCENTICGMYSIIISSGASLPASGTEFFGLLADSQNDATIDVFQGEEKLAWKNTLLQSGIIIDGLTSRNDGGEAGVNITFNVNKKGYLSFKAEDIDDPNNTKELTIKIPNNGYEIVPEGNISAFELIKREIGRLFR